MRSSQPPVIKLLLVDDSELVRAGLRAVILAERSIQIVGEAGNVAAAVEAATKLRPNVELCRGFDGCRQILAEGVETRILFLTSVVDDRLVDQAIRVGGSGYLLKEINGRGLVQAVIDVAAGKSILDPAVTARVMRLVKTGGTTDAIASLSPQERRVLALISEGKTNKEVGVDLNLSEKTVKNYLANIFDKLNVSRRSQAVALYIEKQQHV
jgi:two-component system, NarL family, response regulator DevR